jgi:hypothetical protein
MTNASKPALPTFAEQIAAAERVHEALRGMTYRGKPVQIVRVHNSLRFSAHTGYYLNTPPEKAVVSVIVAGKRATTPACPFHVSADLSAQALAAVLAAL